MNIDRYLFDPGFDHERSKRALLGDVDSDRSRGILYLVERRADGDKSLIHVFRISGKTGARRRRGVFATAKP
jgi:hypothetical protein